MAIVEMKNVPLAGKRVLIREDLNVPLDGANIASDARLRAALPTIEYALRQGAAVIVASHLGRPKEGVFDPALSLLPVAQWLTAALQQPVKLIKDWDEDGVSVTPGTCVLLENVRFLVGEKANDVALSRKMAALCDVYVNDAFATAHRAQASTYGVAAFAPVSCAGPLLLAELAALKAVLAKPAAPLVAIVGGSKVSTKLGVLNALAQKVDHLIVGGGIANTFLAAMGKPIGASLAEPALIDTAKQIMTKTSIPLPTDVVVAQELSEHAQAQVKAVDEVAKDDLILDIGPETIKRFAKLISQANTILWNGPVGVFEKTPFQAGTRALAQAVAASQAYSVAGGGDTLAAIDQFQLAQHISYISTGGGAFLELVEGKSLPGVVALEEAAARGSLQNQPETMAEPEDKT